MSPLLFMRFINKEWPRFRPHQCGTESKSSCLLSLLYADDLVLVGNSPVELQALLDTCAEEATKLGLRSKSEVGGRDSRGNAWRRDTQQPLWLQGSIFEECHLGIELTDSKHCLEEYEARLRKKAVTTSRAPWAFSCYEGDGALWELVAVPGLAFGNAVLAFHRLLGGHWRSGSERPAVLHWACTCTSRPCRATWAGHRPR